MNTITIIVDKQYQTVDVEMRGNGKHERYYHNVSEASRMRLLPFQSELINIFEVSNYVEYVWKMK